MFERTSSRQWITPALLLLMAVHPLSTGATVLEVLSLDDLTRLSSQAVTARCMTLESRRDERRDTIFTRAVFEVERTMVGDRSLEEVSVLLPGGSVDGDSVLVIGAPKIEVGDEVVLMLDRLPATVEDLPVKAQFRLVGLSQGVFHVERKVVIDETGTVTSEALVVSSALPFFEPGGPEVKRLAGGAADLPLQELEKAIVQAASRYRSEPWERRGEPSGSEPELKEDEPDDAGGEAAQAGDEPGSADPDEPSIRVPEGQEVEGQEEGGAGAPDEP